ncbi:hypothetical protein T552_02096 [Pneumocystis carinii B80]|uniref:Uncharacterized protein n=1 Tax=Pneumocystis carinii (strain B80) TaxID=1408658 RepID=A0A0W4ZH10_PNEC8|nr:hypothetical protein T552_02096 [Pneumocystis carinii B80]KTW27655.1 hypothetical protein T552_02096 [Pneumocystis carinii B80]
MPYLNSSSLFEKDRIFQTCVPRFVKPLNSRYSNISTQCLQISDKTSDFSIVQHNWKLSNLTDVSSTDKIDNLRVSTGSFVTGQIVSDRFDKLYASSPMPKLVNAAYFKLSNALPCGESESSSVLKTATFSLGISEKIVQNSCHIIQQKQITQSTGSVKTCFGSSDFSSKFKKCDNSCNLLGKNDLNSIPQNMQNFNIQKYNDHLKTLKRPSYLPALKKVKTKYINLEDSEKNIKNICNTESFSDVSKMDKIKYSSTKGILYEQNPLVKNDFKVPFSGLFKTDINLQGSCITNEPKCSTLSSCNDLSPEDISGNGKDNKSKEIYRRKGKKKSNGKAFNKPLTKRAPFSLTENELKNLSIFGGYISEEKLKRKRRPPGKWWLVSSNYSCDSLEKDKTFLTLEKKNGNSKLRSVKIENGKHICNNTVKLTGKHICNSRAYTGNKQVNLNSVTINAYDFSD